MITRRERAGTLKKAENAFDGEVKKAVNDLIDEVSAGAKKMPAKVAPKKATVPKKPVSLNGKRMGFVKKNNVDELNRKLEEAKAKKEKELAAKKSAVKKTTAKKASVKTRITKSGLIEPKVSKTTKTAKTASAQPPLVSIIIPVRNGARYIDSTIHSVLGQTFADFELIIVDDSSEDGTLRVVREFSSDKIKTVALNEKGGMANARNVGVDEAVGRYICFLNAHDMWQPDKLERQLEFVREKDAAFSYAGFVYSDENGIPSGKAVRVPSEITNLQVARVSSILVSTVMLDMSKLTKDDIKMPATRNPKTATWQKILKKVGRAYGLNEVLAIHGYDDRASLLKKMWRRV